MSFAQPLQLTAEGWRNLHQELNHLETKSQSLPIGIDYSDDGDHIDLDREALTRRIEELRNLLAYAIPVDDTDRQPGVVGVGSRVTVEWETDGEETYTIVGSAEIDRKLGHISYESPIGQRLLGQRVGDELSLMIAGNEMRLRITGVE